MKKIEKLDKKQEKNKLNKKELEIYNDVKETEKREAMIKTEVYKKFEKENDALKQEIVKILKKHDNKFLGMPFGLKYYYDIDSREFEMFYMPRYRNVISLNKHKETFVLVKPSDYYKGRPIYTVVQGHPVSLDVEIDGSLRGNMKSIRLKGRSSSDLYAKLHSPYVQRFFALKGLTTIQYLSIALAIILTAVLSILLTIIYMTAGG